MNIDLLLTNQGEAGLVCDKRFKESVAGVMFDADTGVLTLEFQYDDPIELNIPIDDMVAQFLQNALEIHVGVIEKGMISDNRQVPLVMLNDPFGGGNAGHFPVKPRNSVLAFENFMKKTSTGQPVHRDDLGDEQSASGVLGGMSAAVLQFAPQLARQRTMEAAPQMHHAPSAPGMSMGGGGNNAAQTVRRIQQSTRRRPSADDESEN